MEDVRISRVYKFIENVFKMKSKRGSHVGMILSFVIFVTFLIFIYTTLQPAIKTGRDKQIILDYIKNELIQEFTGNLTTVSLEITKDAPSGEKYSCFTFSDISEVSNLEYSLVKLNENIINSKRSGAKIDVSWDGKADEFYKLFYSEQEFTGGSLTETSCYNLETCSTGGKCEISSVRQDEQILETKIKGVLGNYDTNHEGLRKKFSVPADSDFAINVSIEGLNLGGDPVTSQADIFSEEVVFQYINSSADINTGKMRVSVW